MKSFKYLVFIIIVLLIISVVACTIPEQVNNDDPFDKVEKDQNETTNSPQKTTAGNNENKNEKEDSKNNNKKSTDPNNKSYIFKDTSKIKLDENRRIYSFEKKNDLIYLYVTVMPPTDESPAKFEEVQNDIEYRDDIRPEVKVICQLGDKSGPRAGDLGFGLKDSNAEMRIRGRSTRQAGQKSFKITLDRKAGLWNGQREFNLNKHFFDDTRFRNKLSFDMIIEQGEIPGLRTTFVNLWVKDLSKEKPDKDFVDFGLFTHVEQLDDVFLKNRNLDWKGNIYKAENFDFRRYPDKILPTDDPLYNEKEFSSILEIKDGKKHLRLIKMLDDINDESLSFIDVFNYYFDEENYLTWMAINILIENNDTNSQNFYLYRPGQTDKWFFLPWDYDGAWGFYTQAKENSELGEHQRGVANYWGVLLHNKYFTSVGKIDLLTEKIEELYKFFSPEKVKSYIDLYKPITWDFLKKAPDNRYAPEDDAEYQAAINNVTGTIEKNYKAYYEGIQKPMPVFHWYNGFIDGKPNIGWGESYDFQGDTITYKLEVDDSYAFDSPELVKDNIEGLDVFVDTLKPGKYYARLTIKDSNGNTMNGINTYFYTTKYPDDSKVFATIEFIIEGE
jgi:spore coat protein H